MEQASPLLGFPPSSAGLLKLVFATETLAAGINMPARTTLVAALSRRRDGGVGLLQHNEMLQMAGRAGRRGYDTVGNCVVLQVSAFYLACTIPSWHGGLRQLPGRRRLLMGGHPTTPPGWCGWFDCAVGLPAPAEQVGGRRRGVGHPAAGPGAAALAGAPPGWRPGSLPPVLAAPRSPAHCLAPCHVATQLSCRHTLPCAASSVP